MRRPNVALALFALAARVHAAALQDNRQPLVPIAIPATSLTQRDACDQNTSKLDAAFQGQDRPSSAGTSIAVAIGGELRSFREEWVRNHFLDTFSSSPAGPLDVKYFFDIVRSTSRPQFHIIAKMADYVTPTTVQEADSMKAQFKPASWLDTTDEPPRTDYSDADPPWVRDWQSVCDGRFGEKNPNGCGYQFIHTYSRQIERRQRLMAAIKADEQRRGRPYSHVIFTRPDVQFRQPDRILPITFSTAGPRPTVYYMGDIIYITNRAGAEDVASYNMTIADCNLIPCQQRNINGLSSDVCLARSLFEKGDAVSQIPLSYSQPFLRFIRADTPPVRSGRTNAVTNHAEVKA